MKKGVLICCLCLLLSMSTMGPGEIYAKNINDTSILSIFDRAKWTEDYLDFERRYKESNDRDAMYRTYQTDFQQSVRLRNEELHLLINHYLVDQEQAKSAYYAVVYGLRAQMFEEAISRLTEEIPNLLLKNEQQEAISLLDDTASWISDIMDPTLQQWDRDQSSWAYTDLHTVLLPALRESVISNHQKAYDLYVPMIENVLLKAFMMDVITGVQDEKKQIQSSALDSEEIIISSEQIRAMFAFYPLRNWMLDHEAIFAKEQAEALFEHLRNHPRFGLDRVQERMMSALHAIVHYELQQIFFNDLQQGNRQGALVRAADAVSTASLLEVAGVGWEQEDRFRFVQYHGEQFFSLLQQDKTKEAVDAAFDMLKEMVRFKGVFFRVGEPQLMMDGEALHLGQMASYLDPNTKRTLVSTRFFAESLGATVDFNADQKMVEIIRNGQTIRLQVGSKYIYRNDQREEQILDQTVVLKDGRTYIPLRAAAELLGHQVFWHEGEIVIH